MNIGLIDVDGHNFPNLALMRLSAYHKANGDSVEMWDGFKHYDRVYMSKVFTFSPLRNLRGERRRTMTRDEIVTALRCCANHMACNSCELRNTGECLRIMPAAADLIENQQREIEALRQANEGLRFNLAEKMDL